MIKVFLFICLILISQSSSFAFANLEETCKRAAGTGTGTGTGTDTDYNFCVTSLQVIPMSRSADTKGLALIATNLTIANYTHNLAKISMLLNGKRLPIQVKQALDACSASYNVGVSDLKMATAKIESDDVEAGLVNLSEAWKRPVDCEYAFKKRKEKSMMEEEDDFASRLVTLSLKITVLVINM